MKRCLFLILCWTIAGFAAGQEKKDGPPEPAQADATGAFLTLNPGHHVGSIQELQFTPDAQRLISVGSDATVQIWNSRTGERVRLLRLPGSSPRAAALAPDGKTLLVTRIAQPERGPDKPAFSLAYLLNLEDSRIIPLQGEDAIQSGVYSGAAALAANGDRAFAVQGKICWVWTGLKDIWDRKSPPGPIKAIAQFTIANKLDKNAPNGGAVCPTRDGTRLAVRPSAEDGFQIWDLSVVEKPVKVKAWVPDDGKVDGLAWTSDGKRLATGHSFRKKGPPNPVRLWSAEGKELKTFTVADQPGKPWDAILHRTVFRSDNELLLFCQAADHRFVLSLNPTSGAVRELCRTPAFDYHGTIGTLSADGRLGALADGPGRSRVVLFPVQERASLRYLAGDPFDPSHAGWDPDGHTIARNVKNDRELDTGFDLKELRLRDRIDPRRFIQAVTKRPDGWEIGSANDAERSWVTIRHNDTRAETPHQTDVIRSITLPLRGEVRWVACARGGGLTLNNPRDGTVIHQFRTPGMIEAVAPSPDGKYLLATASNQELVVYRPDQPAALLRVFTSGSDWIVWTNKGYYAASPGGERLMGWTIYNGPNQLATFHPASRFRKDRYRPDLIRLVLEKGSFKEAFDAVGGASAEVEELLPPKVELTLLETKRGPGTDVTVKVRATATAVVVPRPVRALHLLLDGRPAPISDDDHTFATPVKKGDRPAVWEWTLKLPPGKHHLAALARSTDSVAISSEIDVDGPVPVAGKAANKLHVLCFGVSQYKNDGKGDANANLNLKYAAKDADEIANVLEKCSGDGRLFSGGTPTVLKDSNATSKNILAELEKLSKDAAVSSGDLVVIYFSGHGEKDEAGKLHLLTHDTDRDDLAKTTLSGEDLKKVLADVPCKVLLLLDACHSAAVGPKRKMAPATDDLTRALIDEDCAVAVLAAAMGKEFALEGLKDEKGKVIENGVFTWALKEALRGAARANPDDGRVYVHDLYQQVFNEVRRVSDQKQTPFLALPWSVTPFAVVQRDVPTPGGNK